MLTYTNHIDPANRVIASAMRFWTFSPRCLACATSAGCSGVLTLGWIAICRLLPAQPGHALPGTGTSVSITPYAAVDPGPARAQGGTLTAGEFNSSSKGAATLGAGSSSWSVWCWSHSASFDSSACDP